MTPLRFLIVVTLLALAGWGVMLGKQYTEEWVVELIRDEVRHSCNGCDLSVEHIEITPFSLAARASGVRVTRGNAVGFTIEDVRAKVSIGDILRGTLDLTQLHLLGVEVFGVDEESILYKFIDRLTTAAPPGSEPLIEVKLHALAIEGGKLHQDLGRFELVGEGVSLDVIRTARDDFDLLPAITQAWLHERSRQVPSRVVRSIFLGGLEGLVTITDNEVLFQQLDLIKGEARVRLGAVSDTSRHNEVRGVVRGAGDASSLELTDYFQGMARLEGDLGNRLGSPTLKGTLASSPDVPFALVLTESMALPFQDVLAAFAFRLVDQVPEVKVRDVLGRGHGLGLLPSSFIDVDGDGVVIGADGYVNSLDLFGLAVSDAKVHTAVVVPNEGATVVNLQGSVGSLSYGGVTVGDARFVVEISEGTLAFVLNSEVAPGQPGAFQVIARLQLLEQGGVRLEELRYAATALQPIVERVQRPMFEISTAGEVRARGSGLEGGSAIDVNLLYDATEAKHREPLQGTLNFDGDVLNLQLSGSGRALEATAKLPLRKNAQGAVQVSLHDYQPPLAALGDSCFRLSGEVRYEFGYGEPLRGGGEVKNFGLQVGCEEARAAALAATPLAIQNGALSLNGIVLRGPKTELNMAGNVGFTSGWKAEAVGSLNLESLGEILPMVDDIRGTVTTTLALSGELAAPALIGKMSLKNGGFTIAEGDVHISEANGELELVGDRAELRDIEGILNGGRIHIEGTLYPFDFTRSSIKTSISQVLFDPTREISLTVGGELNIKPNAEWHPRIEGRLEVLGADFAPDIGLKTLVKSILTALLSSSEGSRGDSKLPSIELAVQLVAPQGIFVTTNWAEAELRGDLFIDGTLNAPRVGGEVEALSGWFGFRDRKFFISSGHLRFRPERTIPQIDLLGESSLMARTGENVLVLMEILGDLASPKVVLSSDRGLSQSDLLSLLAGFDRPAPSGFGRSLGLGLAYSEVSPLSRESPYVLERILYRFFSLDSLAIEPQLDSFTGTLQPAVIAEKRLTEDVAVHGVGLFSSAYTQSEARVDYSLTEDLSVSGALRSISALYPIAFEGNVSWVILAPQNRLLSIEVRGNKSLRSSQVTSFTRLKENTRLPISDLERISELVTSGYKSEGFFDAKVVVRCEEGEVDCNRLVIEVEEGPQSRVHEVIVRGELPSGVFTESVLDEMRGTAFATAEYLNLARDTAIRLLRREGYIGARVSAAFEDAPRPNRRNAILQIQAGRPVSFVFHGATQFSAEDFLGTLDLFGRRQPFGNNSIMILLQNMGRLYQEKGFYGTTFALTKGDDPMTGRRTYVITVSEGQHFGVGKVEFADGGVLSEKEIVAEMGERGFSGSSLLRPPQLLDEDLANKEAALRDVYVERGFPEARVSTSKTVRQDKGVVDVTFAVIPGPARVFRSLSVDSEEGTASVETIEKGMVAPISREKVNGVVERIVEELLQEGYFAPQVAVDYGSGEEPDLRLKVTPGIRSVISNVAIEGCRDVAEDVVQEHLGLQQGVPLREEALSDARRRVMKSGLFARVDISTGKAVLQASSAGTGAATVRAVPLTVRVVERPLRAVSIGAGANSSLGIHFFGEAVDRQIWRDGRSLSARADLYYEPTIQEVTQGVANLLFSNPRFLDSEVLHTESLTYQRSTQFNQSFQLGRLSLGSSLFDNLTNGVNASLGHTLNLENIFDVEPDAVLSDLDEGNLTLSIFNGLIGYDQRNDPLNPSAGWYASMDWRVTSRALGSDADYFGFGGRLSAVHPLFDPGSRWSIAYLGRGGAMDAFGGTTEVPITQRYYLGGRNTVRGFRENSLGPRGSQGSVIGGDVFVMNSVELRYRVAELATLNLFLDTGNVYLRSLGVDFGNQRESVGIGCRLLTPVGPVGIDIGAPLDERSGEPSVRLHFTVGSQY